MQPKRQSGFVRITHNAPRVHPLLLVALASLMAVGCGSRSDVSVPDADVPAPLPDVPVVRPPLCIEVDPLSPPVLAEITTPVALAVVDLFFLIDATASMTDEIDNVREGLRDVIVPGVSDAIPDARFGLGLLGEFPVEPFGPDTVRPYEARVLVGGELSMLEGSLGALPEWANFDDPEAHVEALYQVATGDGLGDFIMPSFGCPQGGVGGACFREDAFRVIMLITDAPFHNGPDGANPYTGITPTPHTYREALAALVSIDARVIGLGAEDVGRPNPAAHLERLATDTNAVADDGRPLAFNIGSTGDGVGRGIVDAIERLASGLRLDVDATFRGLPGGDFDASALVQSIRPVRAIPQGGVESISGTLATGVLPGTRLVFEVSVDASMLSPSRETRRARGLVVFRAFGRSRIGDTEVEIVIPGTDGGGCDS